MKSPLLQGGFRAGPSRRCGSHARVCNPCPDPDRICPTIHSDRNNNCAIAFSESTPPQVGPPRKAAKTHIAVNEYSCHPPAPETNPITPSSQTLPGSNEHSPTAEYDGRNKQALSSTLISVNPWFLSTSTRPNTDPNNPQHFKGLQSNSKQMFWHKSVRTPHLDFPRQTAPIRGYPRLSTTIRAKKHIKTGSRLRANHQSTGSRDCSLGLRPSEFGLLSGSRRAVALSQRVGFRVSDFWRHVGILLNQASPFGVSLHQIGCSRRRHRSLTS